MSQDYSYLSLFKVSIIFIHFSSYESNDTEQIVEWQVIIEKNLRLLEFNTGPLGQEATLLATKPLGQDG